MPVIILGSIYVGIFTPTEASAVAVIYALFIGVFVYKRINFKVLRQTFRRSVIATAVIMFIMANAGVFGFLLNRAGVPMALGNWLTEVFSGQYSFLLWVNIALFVLRMFIDTSARS